MKYIPLILIFLFYIFFFMRAFLLSRSIGKTIKAKDPLLNIAIISAGLASILLILQILFTSLHPYLFIVHNTSMLEYLGILLIACGLILSTTASLHLGKSWRIGIDNKDKTTLIISGFYSWSRNPYFLAYDIVLIGMAIYSLSIFVIFFSILTAFFFNALIVKEECHLERMHGDEYINYRKKVRRYI